MSAFYCDGLQELTVGNGVVRLEFYRIASNRTGSGQPPTQRTPEITLALPVQGLAEMLQMLQRAQEQLIKDGVLRSGETVPGTMPSPPLIGVDVPWTPGKN
jgi:hypothetical protein